MDSISRQTLTSSFQSLVEHGRLQQIVETSNHTHGSSDSIGRASHNRRGYRHQPRNHQREQGQRRPQRLDTGEAPESLREFPGKNFIIVWPKHDVSGLQGCVHGDLICPCPNHNKTMKYKCYVFDSGDFHLKGDGGYLNWAFAGKYNRYDKDLSFAKS